MDDAGWQQLGWLASDALGTDRSSVLRQLAAWWMRQPGAKLPPRPTEEQAQAAQARFEAEQQLLERGRGRQLLENGTSVVNG